MWAERPVLNESQAVTVKFGLTLQQIMDVVSAGGMMNGELLSPASCLVLVISVSSQCEGGKYKGQPTNDLDSLYVRIYWKYNRAWGPLNLPV